MMKSWLARLAGVAAVAVVWAGSSNPANAGEPPLPRYSYYPYYYFPHSYWPSLSPQYPEPPGSPYVRPPAYMAYPPFQEPGWRYELWSPMKWYKGSHFWLDQF
ncbi:MAG TPA: hypothetical protein VFG68_02430 [Fimbriiglobus sp.]|nr:hypothetical protein [Fimbriiglobus sp.]